LPGPDKWVSARAGSKAAYAAVARSIPSAVSSVVRSQPLDEAGKAAALVPPSRVRDEHRGAGGIADGRRLVVREHRAQLNVFATFAAFMEGIAHEGFEMWRYRAANQVNEGLNVVMHLSHVGACTGRDHFSGWSLDWINFALGYLPFLRRFYRRPMRGRRSSRCVTPRRHMAGTSSPFRATTCRC
jgi:hypothetical protein